MRHVNYMWSNYFHSYCDFIHCVHSTVHFSTVYYEYMHCIVQISLDSGNTEAHDKLRVLNEMSEAVSSGRAAFESGDWETCVSLLNRAVESVPWDWSLLETRSQCNERRGDLEASHRDLRQMLRLMPASGAAEDSKLLFSTYVRLAQSVYDSGDTEQALRYTIMNTVLQIIYEYLCHQSILQSLECTV